MQLGYYEFATHGDLLLLGAFGLYLVAKNWWDIIRYGLSRHATPATWLAEPAGPAAPAGVGAQLAGAVRRLRRRGKGTPRTPRHRHA